MADKQEKAEGIARQVHDRGGSAADAIRRVFDAFNDKPLAARAARAFFSARDIGRALMEVWPDPQFAVPPYYDECCIW